MAEQTRLGDALDAWLRRQRVSVAHVAKHGKVSRNTIWLIQQGTTTAPEMETLRKIARGLAADPYSGDVERAAYLGAWRDLAAAADHPHEALLWVAVCTGCRQGELFALRWQDIDLDAGRVQIREKVQWLAGLGSRRSAPKTASGVRAMSLPALAVAALRAHKAAQDEAGYPNPLGLAFPTRTGTHLQASNWNKQVWRAWLRAAGVDETIQFRILTRKAHHSLLVSLGVDPETLRHRAGHTRASTTMEHYVMSVSGADEDAARKLDGALRDLMSAKPPRKQSDRQSATNGFPGSGAGHSKGKPSRKSG